MTQPYFTFLRYCLDDATPLPKDVGAIDWNDLFDFAKKQSMLGVYFRGIRKLPYGVLADRRLLAKWTVIAQKMRQKSYAVTLVTDKVSNYFKKNGFKTFVLKGQGNALMYPEPWLRNPGDVDIFVAGGDKRVISFAKENMHGRRPSYHHIGVEDVDGESVEVHYRPTYMFNPIHNRRLQKWFDANTDRQCSNEVTVAVDGRNCTFAVPTADFNIIYQLLHMERHVMQSGLGLRQLVDYYQLLMTADVETIQSPTIQTELRQLGIAKLTGGIMWVLKEILALPDERMVAAPNPKFGNVILNDMLEGGNFGQHAQMSSWMRDTRVGRNIRIFEHALRLCWHYPSESLWYPFFRLCLMFWRLYH